MSERPEIELTTRVCVCMWCLNGGISTGCGAGTLTKDKKKWKTFFHLFWNVRTADDLLMSTTKPLTLVGVVKILPLLIFYKNLKQNLKTTLFLSSKSDHHLETKNMTQ